MTGGGAGRSATDGPLRSLVGVGGIGAGIVFALDGDDDLGRNESRPGRLLDARDYCKLHIVAHYPAVLLGGAGREAMTVLPVGRVGDDEVGRRLVREMAEAGMDTRYVRASAGACTLFSVCFLYPDGSGGNITTSGSAAALLTTEEVDGAAAHLDGRSIALAVPEAPLAARTRLLERARERGALAVAAFTSAEIAGARGQGVLRNVDLLAMNEDEAAMLVGTPFPKGNPEAFLERCANAVAAENARARIVVTCGRRGAWGFEGGRWTHCPALAVEAASTAGAGDALLGGVLIGLALGLSLTPEAGGGAVVASALQLGALTAAFAVASPHTIPPGLDADALVALARGRGLSLDAVLERGLTEVAR